MWTAPRNPGSSALSAAPGPVSAMGLGDPGEQSRACASYILSQVLGSLVLHIPQQGVGACLAQSRRDAAEAPTGREVQGCAAVEHARVHPGARLEQELYQTPLLGLHSQMQRRLPTRALLQGNEAVSRGPREPSCWARPGEGGEGHRVCPLGRGPGAGQGGGAGPGLVLTAPHLRVNVGSVLEQEFHERPVPLQGGNVETRQTWDGVRVGAAQRQPPTPSPPLSGTSLPLSPQGLTAHSVPLITGLFKHKPKKPPQKSEGKGTQSFHFFRVMLLKLSRFRGQVAE